MITIQIYKVLLPVIGITTAGALLLRPAPVSAGWMGDNSKDFVSSLAQKLGLNQDKVQTALDSLHADRRAEMEKLFEDRLTQAVSDKKISEDQKQKIIAKHKEIMDEKQKMRQSHEQFRSELQKWAEDNQIDPQYLMGFGMKGGSRGFGMRHLW